ncbi:ABC transporter ATP-binding protein [Sphaerimonospora thailandensis]|uniref:ABC transporter domain-containing protein n=1 Tax=Sphaerimonospora thailandensis TaxID=795644 RepID=A0A8J3R7C3_9ACTN|nr:ABC transporter ATP-binding protein [Sphaerimonospora thailandensis]GIH69788.1 hypothetical protein Mth01_20410 [Sphaerimonospora thailandensis]
MSIAVAKGVRVVVGATTVLDHTDLDVARGEIVALMGENGIGKSTLIRCLAGLQRTTEGVILVFGAPPSGDAAFWRDVGLVTDDQAWYPWLTVREHLELIRKIHEPADDPRMEPDALLEAFGLLDRADAAPATLSTGQRQRLSIASVLARPSRLLLLDEPEHGLDADFRERLAVMLGNYASDGGTLIMATHDRELASATEARVIALEAGTRA